MWFILFLMLCIVVALVCGWLLGCSAKTMALLAVGAAALYLLDLYIITR